MKTFHCDVSEQRSFDIKLSQEGSLCLTTEIELKGDYRTGPVPVSVRFMMRFTPDRKYWKRNADDSDECYAVAYEKSFESADERAMYHKTFYKALI